MDILYLVGPNSKCDYFDLKCSLRSIDMYGKNVDRVFVCGYCPEFLSNEVIKLPLAVDKSLPKNKNIWRQIVHCVKNSDIGVYNDGDFLISMDDHFYMNEVDFNKYPVLAKLSGEVHGGMLPQTPNPKRETHKGYEKILIHTNKFCADHKLPTVFLTLHANMRLNKYSIEQMDDLNNEMFNYKDSDLECVVIAQNYRLLNNPFRITFAEDFKAFTAQSVEKMLKANKRTVFSTEDFEIGDDMYNILKEKYPNPSKYEKVDIYIKSRAGWKGGEPVARNWGDDLNFTFLPLLCKNYQFTKHIPDSNNPNYHCIGSFKGEYNKCIIWGGGSMYNDNKIPEYFDISKVLCVRGPLTQRILQSHNINCPNRYGDPALLLPYVYHPNKTKIYDIGIIPHHMSINRPILKEFVNKCKQTYSVKVIDLTNYDKWTDIVDQLLSCKYIMSESLHGLIASESYQIPYIKICFSGNIRTQKTKFVDFYESIGREYYEFNIDKSYSIIDMIKMLKSYQPSPLLINRIEDLIVTCPFEIDSEYMNKIQKDINKKKTS